MFQNILCAVDGSAHALKAAETASQLAAKLGASLTFLTVTKELKVTDQIKRYMEIENLTGTPQYVLDEMTDEVLSKASQCAKDCGVKTIRTEVKVGHPARIIVNFAERAGADLIVIGSRGLGDIGGAFLGSVSHKVSSLAKCACLMIK
ncbi:MAG: universal stress protein [Kiloniellaceae bacterium]